MQKVIVSAQNISFELPSRTLFKGINISVKHGDRIALVGTNGSGKSTLLKIFAGEIKPTNGSLDLYGHTYYLSQIDMELFQSTQSVEKHIAERHEISWRSINVILHRLFTVHNIIPSQQLKTLSGGEFVKLHLAIAMYYSPDLLLLDEPTNHLDIPAMENLRAFLNKFKGAFIIVSHNPFFLDMVASKVWELNNGKINIFGGNFSHYKEQKTIAARAQESEHEIARKQLRKIRRSLEREKGRAARSGRIGKEMKADRSTSRGAIGYHKEQATKSKGKKEKKFDAKLTETREKFESSKIKQKKTVYVRLRPDVTAKKRTLIRVDGATLTVLDRELISNFSLTLNFGDRIVIVGRNGCGKTALIKSLLDKNPNITLGGAKYITDGLRIVYMSQNYEMVDTNLTLFENMQRFNPSIPYETLREQLGSFMFFTDEEIKRRASVLSGGEIARLAFSMVTASQVDLLILDEPTNNLDVETVDAIAASLIEFPGGILVVSHNIDFLQRIGVNRAYAIYNKNFIAMQSTPQQPQEFYREIVEKL